MLTERDEVEDRAGLLVYLQRLNALDGCRQEKKQYTQRSHVKRHV